MTNRGKASNTCLQSRIKKTETGLTTHEMWTGTKESSKKVHDLHVFGCPVCVLQKEIADGKETPRWKNLSTRGMSEKHSGNVQLVLNPKTGMMTPQ